MVERQELSSEQRTSVLWSQDFRRLPRALTNMDIEVVGSRRRIRIDQARPWSIAENTGRYKAGKDGINVGNLPTGTLWALYWPLRRMTQLLITVREDGKKRALIELEKASRYDPDRRLYVPMKRKGDIATFLELEDNEALTLRFINELNVLYLDRSARAIPEIEEVGSMVVDPEAADRYMRALLGE